MKINLEIKMNLSDAVTAGTIAASLNAITEKIAALDTAMNNAAYISAGSVILVDPVLGTVTIGVDHPWTVDETAVIFSAMKDLLEQRRPALEAALAAL